MAVNKAIRDIVERSGKLPIAIAEIADQDDLFALGLSSFSCVQIMLGIEEKFGFEFPDEMLNRTTFTSIAAIIDSVEQLRTSQRQAEGAE